MVGQGERELECVFLDGDRAELLREASVAKGLEARERRKWSYDGNRRWRRFSKGDLVLLWTPSFYGKLEESWSGQWEVLEQCGLVNYKISPDGIGKGKALHLNSIKEYAEREEKVCRLTVNLMRILRV